MDLQRPEDPVDDDDEEIEPVELRPDLRSGPLERGPAVPLRRRNDRPGVTAFLRAEVTPDDAALARLDRVRTVLEDRDVVIGRLRQQADEDAEAALRPVEQQDVSGRRGRKLREGRGLGGVQG